MNRTLSISIICALILAAPAATLAQQASSEHPSAPAPAYHPSAPAPAYHPSAPAYHPAPAPPIAHPVKSGGFGFPQHDIYGAPPPVHLPPVRPPTGYRVAPQQTTVRANPPHAPYPTGPYHYWHGPTVRNPRGGRRWWWNHSVIWYPVPYYWGGGFWGPWQPGVTAAPLYGAIIDYGDQSIYPSYDIEPSSPGAQLLADYGLTQTDCGPPNLVVIWGPDSSVICAYPNNLVAPGNYELDPATLTLQSLNAPSIP